MKKKQRFKGYAAAVLIAISTVYAGLFGVSFLTNFHAAYLRGLAQWTVLIHNSQGAGATGFITKGKSGKKYIMTNGHVCDLQENGKLQAIYRGDTYVVTVVKQYQWNDLCAIEAPGTSTYPVSIAWYATEGESAYAIGHPLLEPLSISLGELSGPVTIQIVKGYNTPPEQCTGPTYSMLDTSQTMYAFFGVTSLCIRTLEAEAGTIGIQPGNSGSPIVNLYGRVIGVAFAANQSGTRSYIVPLKDLKDFLKDL